MSKFVGTIIDETYYRNFLRHDDKNTYEKRICPYCDEEIEVGFYKGKVNAPYSIAPLHQCKNWVNEVRRRVGVIEKFLLPDNGFIFEPPKPQPKL